MWSRLPASLEALPGIRCVTVGDRDVHNFA
jgi:hypothetical protein